jgi:hypothetical protein
MSVTAKAAELVGICNASSSDMLVMTVWRGSLGVFADRWGIESPIEIEPQTCETLFTNIGMVEGFLYVQKRSALLGWSWWSDVDYRGGGATFESTDTYARIEASDWTFCLRDDGPTTLGGRSLDELGRCPSPTINGYRPRPFSLWFKTPADQRLRVVLQ